MTDAEMGWLAGILDGEGTVTLLARGHGKFRQPTLSITSTDKEILLEVRRLIGGNISNVRQYKPNMKPSWIWKLNGSRTVMDVLRVLLPHLHCPSKIRRAKYLLEGYARVTKRNGYYTPDEKVLKAKYEEDFFSA